LISFLIWLLVLIVIFGLLYHAIGLLPMDETTKRFALLLLIVIFILMLLAGLTGVIPVSRWVTS